jgi:hypothetical protein
MTELPIREQFYPLALFPKAGLPEPFRVDNLVLRKAIQISHMDDRKFFPKWVIKPPFGKASLERHLPSLKTSLRPSSGPGLLAFGAPASRLSMARSHSPAHPLSFLS